MQQATFCIDTWPNHTARQVDGLRSQKKDLHLAAARFAAEQVAVGH
jgi:hypothetical protein